MIEMSALGWDDRTLRSSGSSTGLTSLRGPPKRANLARTRDEVGTELLGWSGFRVASDVGVAGGVGAAAGFGVAGGFEDVGGFGGVIMPGTPGAISSLIVAV